MINFKVDPLYSPSFFAKSPCPSPLSYLTGGVDTQGPPLYPKRHYHV